MPIEIAMPSYSESMESADLIGWLVSPGDFVNEGDPIAEIETDKATGELESPSSGTLVEICVPEGSQGVTVGTVVARLEPAEAQAATGEPQEVSPPAAPDAPQSNPPAAAETEAPEVAEPAQTAAPIDTTEPETTTPAPPTEKATPAEATAPHSTSSTALARRVAEQAGIDIEGLKGTGSRGRVTKADVEIAAAGGPATTVRTSAAVAVLDFECDVSRALAVCEQVSQRESEFEIGLLSIAVRAVGLALDAVPETLDPSTDERVARDILVQSVGEPARTVSDANRRSLAVISEELSREASTTIPAPPVQIYDFRSLSVKRIQPPLLEGGVIALGLGKPEGAPLEDTTVNLTLCIDASSVDIGLATRFLAEFRQRLEDPLEMLL